MKPVTPRPVTPRPFNRGEYYEALLRDTEASLRDVKAHREKQSKAAPPSNSWPKFLVYVLLMIYVALMFYILLH